MHPTLYMCINKLTLSHTDTFFWLPLTLSYHNAEHTVHANSLFTTDTLVNNTHTYFTDTLLQSSYNQSQTPTLSTLSYSSIQTNTNCSHMHIVATTNHQDRPCCVLAVPLSVSSSSFIYSTAAAFNPVGKYPVRCYLVSAAHALP